jgi:hypothetical protein
MYIILLGVAPTATEEGRPWWSFLILRIWKSLIRAMNPPSAMFLGGR